jgi:hypothetical protein
MKRHLSRKQFLSLGVYGGLGLIGAHCTLDDTPESTGAAGNGGSSSSTTNNASTSASTTGPTGGSGGSSSSSTTGNGGSGGSASGNGGAGGSGGSGGRGGSGGSAGSGGKGGSGGSGGSKDAGAGGGGQDGGASCGTNVNANVSMNHAANPHALVIPPADIAAGVAKVYVTTNVPGMPAQQHMHWVQVTATDFTALKAGQTVKKHSCSGGDHEYVLKCGGTTDMGGAPACGESDCGGSATNLCM